MRKLLLNNSGCKGISVLVKFFSQMQINPLDFKNFNFNKKAATFECKKKSSW